MERPTSTLVYSEIKDYNVRIDMRVGDILLHSAINDPVFQRELERKEILPSDFAVDDGTGLLPENVIENLKKIGGLGAVIRAAGLALRRMDGLETMSSDKEAVFTELSILQERLRREYRDLKRKDR